MLRFIATAAALWVAAKFVPGISYTGATIWPLLGVALIFGIVNTMVGPIIKLFSLPLIVLSLGVFALIINAAMLMLTSWLAIKLSLPFHVSGFLAAFLGSLVISFVSAMIMMTFEPRRQHVHGVVR
jgi:putative membrane protein